MSYSYSSPKGRLAPPQTKRSHWLINKGHSRKLILLQYNAGVFKSQRHLPHGGPD